MFYVYVLQDLNDPDRFYLGYSSDLKQRLQSHNEGRNRSTKHTQWKLVYYEAYTNKAFAIKREASLKRNSNMRRHMMDRIKGSLRD